MRRAVAPFRQILFWKLSGTRLALEEAANAFGRSMILGVPQAYTSTSHVDLSSFPCWNPQQRSSTWLERTRCNTARALSHFTATTTAEQTAARSDVEEAASRRVKVSPLETRYLCGPPAVDRAK